MQNTSSIRTSLARRQLLRRAAGTGLGLALAGGSRALWSAPERSWPEPLRGLRPIPELPPIEASTDRIIGMNVCTRPFRAQGPRIELERFGRKHVVHHYGHGGSGWSLSWGSAAEAIALVNNTGARQIAVIGCGAIGLTTAVAAQRAGYAVTIYTRELPPEVRSNNATGVWSPDSRICTAEHGEAFGDRWERMTRLSHHRYQNLLGLPGQPVEYQDIYQLSDTPFGGPEHNPYPEEPTYPSFSKERTPDLNPKPVELSPQQNPFAVAHARRSSLMLFNISSYTQFLLNAFARLGGRLEIMTLGGPEDFAKLREHTLVNCTGYGARALLGDESLVPVRGQTAKLIPQPEVQYGVQYWDAHVSAYPRRDGILVQAGAANDFGNASETVNRKESLTAVARLNALMQGVQSRASAPAPP